MHHVLIQAHVRVRSPDWWKGAAMRLIRRMVREHETRDTIEGGLNVPSM